MLSTSSNPSHNNIMLKSNHFEKGYKIGYGKSANYTKSYIAPLYLLKEVKLEHMKKVGKLTESGINFLKEKKSGLPHTDWQTHYEKISK